MRPLFLTKMGGLTWRRGITKKPVADRGTVSLDNAKRDLNLLKYLKPRSPGCPLNCQVKQFYIVKSFSSFFKISVSGTPQYLTSILSFSKISVTPN